VLDAARTEIVCERSARKAPLGDAEVRALLARVERVIVARGAKLETRPASAVRPAELRGPTGKYRAPMVLRGKTLLVGFSAAALRELL